MGEGFYITLLKKKVSPEVKCLNAPQPDRTIWKSQISQYEDLIISKYANNAYLWFAFIYGVQIRALVLWKAP